MTRRAAHEDVAPLLGSLALGALEEREAQRLEHHVAACDACTAELAALTGVVGQLARLPVVDALADPVPVPPDLADRVVAAVAADRRQARSRSRLLVAAAAVAVLLVGSGAAYLGGGDGTAPGVPVEAVAVTSAADVTASAGVIAHTWGVEVVLTASGFDAGRAYTVEVLGRDGRVSSAGEFVGTGSRRMVCRLNSSVLRADAAAFVVRDGGGTERARGSLLASGG